MNMAKEYKKFILENKEEILSLLLIAETEGNLKTDNIKILNELWEIIEPLENILPQETYNKLEDKILLYADTSKQEFFDLGFSFGANEKTTDDKVNYTHVFIENLYNKKLLKDEISEKMESLEKKIDPQIIDEFWDIIQYTKRKYLEYGAVMQITKEEYNPGYMEK